MSMYRIAVITASDRCAAGERQDLSGPAVEEACRKFGEVTSRKLLPDDRAAIREELIRLCEEDLADVVFTTGGTGFSPRDVTPEATLDVVERLAPGIPEAMRAYSAQKTNRAMLSRAAAGIRGRTLIVNLPGSPKAVRECLEAILPALGHGLDILRQREGNCGAVE